ncbi:hypothetical protein LCGC14_2976170 [marine sediment metagenome]|uniref:JAB domain-containing protein n=1 Tax=marine sediment metagenome TaxID=412755 RepID=A0A0F8ZFH2_9ZZZZ
MLYLKRNIINQMIQWTLSERPNEAAGYLFKQNALFVKIITANHSAGHFYDENPEALLKLINKHGKVSGIFHSHPGRAIPSAMDYTYMKTTIPLFNCVWFIMSNDLKLRAWTLGSCVGGSFTGPIELEVEKMGGKS